jgi:hypothetical protein
MKEMAGAALILYYPPSHYSFSETGPSHFCSDRCMVMYSTKLAKQYGNWVSKDSDVTTVRGSAEWRVGKTTKESPKIRGASATTKKSKTHKKLDNGLDETAC